MGPECHLNKITSSDVSFFYEKPKKSNLDTNEVTKIIGGLYPDDINISENAMCTTQHACNFGVL